MTLSRREKAIGLLSRFFNSIAYPLLFGTLCIISGLNDHTVYLPLIWTLTALVILSALTSEDTKVLLVPMLMAYYSLGRDTDELHFYDSENTFLQSFHMESFWQLCLCGVLMAGAVLWRLAKSDALKKAFTHRGICTWGILAMDVAFLLGGFFAKGYTPINLLWGLLCGLALTLFYFLVLSMLDHAKDPIPYACKVLVSASWVALLQTLILAFMRHLEGNLIYWQVVQERYLMHRPVLGWGLATIIGAAMVIGIPAAMYLAKNKKYPLLSYFSAVLFLAGTLVVNARGAMLVGALTLFVCVLISCAKGANRWTNRIFTLFLIALALGGMIYVHKAIIPLPTLWDKLSEFLRLKNFGNDARVGLIQNGFSDFLSAPLFGVGWQDGGFVNAVKNNVYSSMYHNVGIQFLAATGLVGVIAFFTHLKQMGEIAVRRFSIDKLLLLFVPLMILALSLFDNFFFYPNFQITYAVFLSLAEWSLERSRADRLRNHRIAKEGKRPRVAFTYVEAGKGHIIPEEAVARIFKQKYGDNTEIIESRFYSETNDPKLKKSEHLFTETVKNQNKNFVAGMLCRIGTFLCGDALSLQWTMACTPSGIQACKRAKKHLEELDSDLLFTTHWSTAFYASKLENPPYTVLLCPDPYSNGMFNVDVNEFLIPTEVGRKQTERRRMYAGGNGKTLPLPLRPEAKEVLSRREELRKKHNIDQTAFTIVLMDGGYGMARMEGTVRHLLKVAAEPMTVIALCGTNDALRERLSNLTPPEHVDLRVIGFSENVLEYVSLSDLFVGKAGANALAEAAYFGIPILITKCATYIEKHTRNYYVKTVGGALYIPSARKAAQKNQEFAHTPALLSPYREGMSALLGISGEERIADLLYEAIENQ